MTSTTLDLLAPRRQAVIISIDWDRLAPEEARRLRAIGIDEGAEISVAHRGIFMARDPLAVKVGRMTVALRRAHAQAIYVEEVAGKS